MNLDCECDVTIYMILIKYEDKTYNIEKYHTCIRSILKYGIVQPSLQGSFNENRQQKNLLATFTLKLINKSLSLKENHKRVWIRIPGLNKHTFW